MTRVHWLKRKGNFWSCCNGIGFEIAVSITNNKPWVTATTNWWFYARVLRKRSRKYLVGT